MNILRRLAKLGVSVLVGSYLAGCCITPHAWGHGGYGERGGYSDRR